MVVLTPRFALLAVLASFAAFSLAPPANAAAVVIRGHPSYSDSVSYSHTSFAHAASVTHQSTNKPNVHPVIPLPARLASQNPKSGGIGDFGSNDEKSKKATGNRFEVRSVRSHDGGDLPPLLSSRALHEPKVSINGEDDHVEFSRSPESHHHHHHHHGEHVDKVVIKGNNDNVRVGRSPEPHYHHHHHGNHVDEVIVKGNNDNVHYGRSPEPHHHHHHHHHSDHVDEVVVKGNNDNVHLNRSPEPHHHHHHHSGHVDKVVVKGNNDNVHLNTKRTVLINNVKGIDSYVVAQTRRGYSHQDQKVVLIEGNNINTHVRERMRRAEGVKMEGVPGTVDIVSQRIHESAGAHLASLVLVHPEESIAPTTNVNATWILNASEKNFTQVYMIPVSMNGTVANVTAAEAEDVPVALKVAVFDPNSASMVSYCATFDPNPPAPAPLTAEPCFGGESTPPHKSQIFSYTPVSGVLRPMWFNGEDDGKGPDGQEDDAAPQDPHTPEAAGAASITSLDEEEDDSSPGGFGNAIAPASVADVGNSTVKNASPQDDLQARAQNVTMIFSPAAPELPVSPNGSAGGAVNSIPLAKNITGTTASTSLGVVDSADNSSISDAGSRSTMTVTSGSTQSTASSAKELNVMVGVAREETSSTVGSADSLMTPVSTAPYKWRFRRDKM